MVNYFLSESIPGPGSPDHLTMQQTINRDPVTDTFSQGHLIRVFQLTAESDAAGDGRDLYRQAFELPADIIYGGIALDIGVEGKNDFFDIFIFDPAYQRLNGELFRADAVEG